MSPDRLRPIRAHAQLRSHLASACPSVPEIVPWAVLVLTVTMQFGQSGSGLLGQRNLVLTRRPRKL